ncbi:MAG TPA: TIR domain-containing protein, partial [Pyrinomonadaceae bacterium]
MPADKPQAPPPLIIISYSKEEEKWKDQLVSLFPTDAHFRLMLNRVDEFPGRIDEETRATLPGAKVLVVLLSPTYLNNSWITGEQGELLRSLESERGLRTLPVLVRYCSWEEIPYFRNRNEPLMIDVKPIAEGTVEEQALTLQRIAARILRLAGLIEPQQPTLPPIPSVASILNDTLPGEELRQFSWSPEVEKVLDEAKALGADVDDRTLITPATLVFAFAEIGRAGSPLKTPQFLWEQIAQNNSRYDKILRDVYPRRGARSRKGTTRPVLRLIPDVVSIFELARSISVATIKMLPAESGVAPPLSDGRIHARHLLAAMLTIPSRYPYGSVTVLSLITDLVALRNRFFELIQRSSIPDDLNEWRQILLTKPATQDAATATTQSQIFQGPGQQTESEQVDATADEPKDQSSTVSTVQTQHDDEEVNLKPLLAGFATDYWTGRDLLNIEDDVNALASLVSAWSVEPPLSIGLFGDWGSGKSHFMRQMRQQVEKLSRKARKSKQKQNQIGYYKNIVQIEFNAWHYIEGNLWASLVDHIFANLRVTEKEKLSIVEARRDELMNKLGVKKEIESKIKSKIEERKTQLQAKQREATDLATRAEQKKDDAATQLAGFRSEAENQLNELQIPVTFSEKDKSVLKRIGIKPEEWTTAGDFRRHYDEVKGLRNRLSAQWKLFKTDRKVRRRFLLAAALTLIPTAGLLLPKLSKTVTLPARVLTLIGVVATIFTALLPTWKQFSQALNALAEHDAAVERERQKRIGELQAEVTALAQKVIEAKTEAASIKREIADLDQQIKT